jgi:hypothetical protein
MIEPPVFADRPARRPAAPVIQNGAFMANASRPTQECGTADRLSTSHGSATDCIQVPMFERRLESQKSAEYRRVPSSFVLESERPASPVLLLCLGFFAGCEEFLPSRDWKERYETVQLWGRQFCLQPPFRRLLPPSQYVVYSVRIPMRTIFLDCTCRPSPLHAQDRSAGQKSFEARCAICHGGDGHGTDRAPAIYNKTAARDNASIANRGAHRFATGGMPALQIPDAELGRSDRLS